MMYFLKKLFKKLKDCFHKEVLPPISNSENLSRFIFQKEHFYKSGAVKPQAFKPPKGRVDVSVYRTLDIDGSEIWKLGRFVEKQRRIKEKKISLQGRADIGTKQVINLHNEESISFSLQVEPAPEPHPRHANIIGFPPDNSSNKALRGLVARYLAQRANGHLV